jgi:hypothetical protein
MKVSHWNQLAKTTSAWALCAAVAAVLAACGGANSSADDAEASAAGQSEASADGNDVKVRASSLRTMKIDYSAKRSGYFVDAQLGNDANPGSAAAPWRTLARLSGVTLLRGETIYLRCGSVWRESLVLGARQLVDGAKITSYGANCTDDNKPRITGADLFSGGWTKTGSLWSKPIPAGTPKLAGLFVNGVPMRVAQWPNHGGVGREYALTLTTASRSHYTVQPSAAERVVLNGKDLLNATVQVRTEPWFIEALKVNVLDATGLKLATPSVHPIDGGDGYVLQDKKWMLDAPGEYFHDVANGVLYVVAPDSVTQADLNVATVEGVTRSVALEVSGRAVLTLSQLAVDKSSQDGVVVNHAPGALLEGVDASNNLGAGVRFNLMTAPLAPVRGASIRSGRYTGNGNAGIDAGNAPNVDVVGNTVTQTGMSQAAWSNAGIVSGDGAWVEGNLVDSSAFRGLLFSPFGGARISKNTFSAYCLRLADCAAVYTVTPGSRSGNTQESLVENNRITSSVLNVEGTSGGHILAGIYLDDLTSRVTVRGNVLSGMPIGVLLHNASGNVVESNKVWLTTQAALFASMDRTDGADLMTGNVVRLNQLAPAASVAGAFPALPQITYSKAIRFFHALHGTASLSSGSNLFTGNQIVAFSGSPGYVADVGSSTSSAWLQQSQWTAINPGELISPPAGISFDVYRATLGAELIAGGDFEAGVGNWTSWFSSAGSGGKATLVNGASGCLRQCMSMVSGQANDRLASPHFQMAVGTQYLVSFTAAFSGAGDIGHPDIARPGTPFESFIDSSGLRSSNTTLTGRAGDVIRYEAFFTASSNDAARINLRVYTPGVPVAFDSVSLRPVTGYQVSNFSDWGAVVSAPQQSSRQVSCGELGWASGCVAVDADGNSVAMPTTLAAGASKLLLWANSPWRR